MRAVASARVARREWGPPLSFPCRTPRYTWIGALTPTTESLAIGLPSREGNPGCRLPLSAGLLFSRDDVEAFSPLALRSPKDSKLFFGIEGRFFFGLEARHPRPALRSEIGCIFFGRYDPGTWTYPRARRPASPPRRPSFRGRRPQSSRSPSCRLTRQVALSPSHRRPPHIRQAYRRLR